MSENERFQDVRWFRSKVDGWLAAVLCLPPIGALATLIGAIQQGRPLGAVLPVALVLALYALLFPVEYGIGATDLFVRSGLLRARVPLGKIREVRATNAPWSAPALSLDRLEVRWGDGRFDRARLSPRERDQFLAVLAERTGLERHGDALEPKASA